MGKKIYHLGDGWGGNPNYDDEEDNCAPGAFGWEWGKRIKNINDSEESNCTPGAFGWEWGNDDE